MCVIVNVLLVISESDPSPETMVLGGNKILKLHKHSGGSLLSKVSSLRSAQCLIDA